MTTAPKNDIISAVKEWASPVLIAIVGTLLYSDLTELKSDVKTLLIQQSADRTRIEMLEKDIEILKEQKMSTAVDQITDAVTQGKAVLPVWMRIGPFKKEDEISFDLEPKDA